MEYDVMWKSETYGIELKINPTKESIEALKRFIAVLDIGEVGVQEHPSPEQDVPRSHNAPRSQERTGHEHYLNTHENKMQILCPKIRNLVNLLS